MSMIRISVVTVIAAVVPMMVNVVKAAPNTVMLDTTSYYPGLGGGEFTAYTLPQTFLANYASGAKASGGFETFCLETGVEFSPGATYYYTLGNVTQPVSNGGQGSGLNLSAGAAYLYYQFGKGLLTADYHYSTATPGDILTRQTDDNLLQAAIWYFQGGQSYGGYPTPITANPFYNDALAAFGNSLTEADAAYTGTAVEVLQLWSNYDPKTGTPA